MKVVSKLFLIIVIVTLISASAVGNTRIRESGSDTFIEDTDGGTVFILSDGTWINMTQLNTTSGGGGSGITDDRIHNSNGKNWTVSEANLQLAIDDLTTGGTVWLPKCSLTLNDPTHFNQPFYINNSDINIIGQGKNTLITYDMDRIKITGNNVAITDIWFTGNISGTGGDGAISVRTSGDVENYRFERLRFFDMSHVWMADASGGMITIYTAAGKVARNITIRDVEIYNVSTFGIHLSGSGEYRDILIDHCIMDGCGINSYNKTQTQWVTGFALEHDGYNITIINSKCSNIWESGFHFETNIITSNIVINNCFAYKCGVKPGRSYGSGFIINDNVTLTNSYAELCYEAGIQICGSTTNKYRYGIISGNTISNCPKGISSEGQIIDGVQIVNNIIKSSWHHGIYMSCIRNSTITNNRIYNDNDTVTSGIWLSVNKNNYRNIISDNWIRNGGTGIFIHGDNNQINGGYIGSCSGYGIDVDAGCHNTSIIGIQGDGNGDNIWVESGTYDTLIDGCILTYYGSEAIDNDAGAQTTMGDNLV